MNKKLKSVLAVIAGMLIGIILSLLTDFILETIGIFPNPSEGLFVAWMLVLATIYRSVYTGLGGYVTARIAPGNKMKHVKILGILAVAGNLLGLIITWNMNLGPHWYPIALTILAFPSVLIGGKLFRK